jgi:hypothetical protein
MVYGVSLLVLFIDHWISPLSVSRSFEAVCSYYGKRKFRVKTKNKRVRSGLNTKTIISIALEFN